jgi:replication factor C subunit 1
MKKVSFCNICDTSEREELVGYFQTCYGAQVVTWAPNICALIYGGSADDAAHHWKYRTALKLGIPIIAAASLERAEHVPALPWTEKYRPRATHEIVGNPEAIAALKSLLTNPSAAPRAALVTGPPGIGKTSAVHAVARESGYTIVEYNASDTRSATAIRAALSQAAHASFDRRVVIMDEVDGMSSGDRGGIGELAKFIKTSRFPIICIANERSTPRLRPLAAVCLDVRFQRPQRGAIARAIAKIAVAEGLRVAPATIESMCERTSNDFRAILNFLQFSSVSRVPIEKDMRLDAFSATGRLFCGAAGATDGDALVWVDYGLVPLMVGEAYVAAAQRGGGGEVAQLERCVRAGDALGDADIYDRLVHTRGAWGLAPAVTTAVVGAARAAGGPAPFQIFPQWLGRASKRAKHRRWYADLGARSGVDRAALPDACCGWRRTLFEMKDADAICNALDAARLTRDDMMETLVEMAFCDSDVKMDTKLKSAVTRAWNKRAGAVNMAVNAMNESNDDTISVYSESDTEYDAY